MPYLTEAGWFLFCQQSVWLLPAVALYKEHIVGGMQQGLMTKTSEKRHNNKNSNNFQEQQRRWQKAEGREVVIHKSQMLGHNLETNARNNNAPRCESTVLVYTSHLEVKAASFSHAPQGCVPKVVFPKVVFPKVMFLKVVFPKVTYPKVNVPPRSCSQGHAH